MNLKKTRFKYFPNIDNLNNKKFTFENISLNNLNFTYNLDNEKILF